MLVNLIDTCDQLTRICDGVYVVNGYVPDSLLQDWYKYSHQWPEFQGDVDSRLATFQIMFENETYHSDYGSCDSPEQFLSHNYGKILQESKHQYCVLLTFLSKKDHSGYRWHKNGPYIGEKDQQYEHLGDEPEIDHIYQFSIYRRKEK